MVQMLVHHKWFIRAGLAMFWAAEVIAWAFDYGFITYLVTDHLWIMVIIIFFSVKYLLEPFYAPFVKITTHGGETVMEKSTKVMLAIIAGAITFSILMIWDVSRTFIIQTFFIDTVLANGYLAILGFEAWLKTFSPLWIVSVTFIGAMIFAVVLNTLVRPRLPFTHKTPQTTSSTIHRSSPTPANATTRPESPPVQKVEISVKAEPTPKAETVKEETVTA